MTRRASTLLCLALLCLAAAPAAIRAGSGPPGAFRNPPAAAWMAAEAQGGGDGPFFASAIRTASGELVPRDLLPRPEACAGCHPDETAEHAGSAHAHAGLDNPWYRVVFDDTRREAGEAAARWCAGCHTPGLLLAGGLSRAEDGTTAATAELANDPLATRGVGCVECHATRVVSTIGQAAFELDPASLVSSLAATGEDGEARTLVDPEAHRQAWSGHRAGGSELCATCHRGQIDEPLNGYRYFPVHDDYGPWQGSSYSGRGTVRSVHFPEPAGCAGCHMEAGGGHRFAATNNALPTLRGDEAQLAAVREFLGGGWVTLDLFAMTAGRPPIPAGEEPPADVVEPIFAPLDRIPATVRRGESYRLELVVRPHGVGHTFPGGKTDLHDLWVEVRAVDGDGETVFWSGRAGPGEEVDPGAHLYRTVWVDEEGERVEHHRVWKARAAAFERSIEPTGSERVLYRLDVPPDAADPLRVTARLRHRKFPPGFTRWAFDTLGSTPGRAPGQPPPELPIITLAEDEVTLRVVDAETELPDMTAPELEPLRDADRFRHYGVGAALQGDLRSSGEAFRKAVALDPDDVEAWANLGRLGVVGGSFEEGRKAFARALEIDPGMARAHHFLGLAARNEADLEGALEQMRAAAESYPRDPLILRQIATTQLQAGDFEGAASTLEDLLAVDPHDALAHFNLVRAARGLGDAERAERHQRLFERFQVDETAERYALAYLAEHPDANRERQRIHEHRSGALEERRSSETGAPAGAVGGGTVAAAATPAADASAAEAPAADTSSQEPANVRLVDATEESGVDWTHDTGAFGERWMPETIGPGVVVFDADGDDRLDLLLINGRNFPGKPGEASTQRLYVNRGNTARKTLRFEDGTAAAGLDLSAYCLGGAAGDLDNDGDSDLFLTCVGQDLLLRNDGGRFTEVGAEAGISRDYEFGAGTVLFDADGDGLLDIYAARYVTWSPEDDLYCSLDGNTKSYCTPRPYGGASPRFYHNLGGWTFEDRTKEAGLHAPEAKALGVSLLDYDWDGHTDLLVAGDTVPNLLYRNRGDGTFEETGLAAGIALSEAGRARGGMGVDAADYERSGRPGAVITYFSREMVGLYKNLGDGFFFDTAPSTEVGRKTFLTLGWGTFFFDYDLDGWLDLLVVNGHLDEQVENLQDEVSYAQPQQLFRNRGGGKLVEVTSEAAPDMTEPLVGRGAAFGDLDGDGDLDVVVTTNGGPAKLFRNQGEGHGHWLRLELTGAAGEGGSNRDGIGARIEVTADGGTQSWLVRTGGSYLSHSQISPTFGLGDAEKAEKIVVRWPSGRTTTLEDVPADQVLEIREPAEGDDEAPEPDAP